MKRPRLRRASRWILGGLAVLVLLASVVVAALPAVVRWLVVNRWEALTEGTASIDRVEIRLRHGQVALHNVRLSDRPPGPPIVELERLTGAFRWGPLFKGELRVRTLDLTAPTIRLVRTETGDLNVARLFAGPREGGFLSVWLEQAALARGRVVFEDRQVSPPRTFEARDIAVELRDVTSQPGAAQGTASASLLLQDAPVRLEADGIGLAPLRAHGTLTLGELDLAPWLAYAPASAPVIPGRAQLAGRVELRYDAAEGLRAQGEATVTDLALLRPPQQEPLVQVPRLSATWRDLVYRDRALSAAHVELAGDPTLVDASLNPPLRLPIAPLRVVAEDVAYPSGPPGRLRITAGLPRNGELEVDGRVDPGRPTADLEVTLRALDLALARPYLPAGSPLSLARGRLSGAVSLTAAADGLGATGELTATDLVLLRRGQAEPFLTHPRLRLTATALTFGGGQLAAQRLALEGNPTVVDTTVTPPARLDFARLGLTADDVTWPVQRPWRVDGTGALTDGGRTTLKGTFDPSTLDADVRATFAGVAVKPAASYLPRDAAVTLLDGQLGATVHLRHTRRAGVSLQADGTVAGLAMGRPGQPEPLLRDPRVSFTLRDLSFGAGTVGVRQATLAGTPTVTDASVTPPRRIGLRGLTFQVDGFAWPPERPAQWTLGADLPGSGALTGRGALLRGARGLEARLELRDADLAPWPRWLAIRGPLAGRLDADADGRLTFGTPLQLTVQGWTRIRDGVLGPAEQPVLRLPRGEATGVEFGWPARVRVKRLVLERPAGLIERAEDGSFPVRTMFGPPGDPAPDADPPAEPAPGPPVGEGGSRPGVTLDEAVIEEGQLRFLDRARRPVYSEEITRLALTLRELAPGDPAELVLQGVIGSTGALELRGEIAPWARPFRLELAGELREFPLPRTNPFFRRFFDWLLRRGSLTTKLHYRIVGDRLEASNQVRVERLNVVRDPAPVPAEGKIGLPLGLIVAMATDARGNLAFDLPVEGRLGAPGFSLGDAVMSALRNVLVNLVTSPLQAIGRVLRRDDDSVTAFEIDPVPFPAGSAAVEAAADQQLRQVGDFLRAAPNIGLLLRPVLTPADLTSLRTREVTARIQRLQREAGLGSFEAAAAALFAREHPGTAPPEGVDEIVSRLRDAEPVPEEARQELARARVEAARRALVEASGIEAERLTTGDPPPAVREEGPGRVELELAR